MGQALLLDPPALAPRLLWEGLNHPVPVSTLKSLQGTFGSNPWTSLAIHRVCVLSHTLTRQCRVSAAFGSCLVTCYTWRALSATLLHLNPQTLLLWQRHWEGRCPASQLFLKFSRRYWLSGNEEVVLLAYCSCRMPQKVFCVSINAKNF